jgi:hypothetical protein
MVCLKLKTKKLAKKLFLHKLHVITQVHPQKQECRQIQARIQSPSHARQAEIPVHKMTRREGRMKGRLFGKEKARTEAGHEGESLCGILCFLVLFSLVCIALSPS